MKVATVVDVKESSSPHHPSLGLKSSYYEFFPANVHILPHQNVLIMCVTVALTVGTEGRKNTQLRKNHEST